ncbi:MAG: hypothetical protein ACQESR_21535, partial [Planctomycetota bacterium]
VRSADTRSSTISYLKRRAWRPVLHILFATLGFTRAPGPGWIGETPWHATQVATRIMRTGDSGVGSHAVAPQLYYAEGKRNNVAGAVAPGVWDIDEYPYLGLDYRIPEGGPVAIRVEPFDAKTCPVGEAVRAIQAVGVALSSSVRLLD